VSAAASLALTEWDLGEVESARRSIDRAIRRADELGLVALVAEALHWKTVLECRRGDVRAARLAANALLGLTEEHGIKTYAQSGQMYAIWARGRLADSETAASEIRQALAADVAQGIKGGAPWRHGLLAELEAATGTPDRALSLIDQGLAIADETGAHVAEPYLYRLRGDSLAQRDKANPALAEEAYRMAIKIAKDQGARSYELLTSLSLAKLYRSTGRLAEAYAVLAPALAGFSPTPEMPEIAEAQALLALLTETDEVKADAAHRQRLTQLRVAYGNALFSARGFGALETTEAFARARESSSGDGDSPGRLAVDYGLWVGCFTRGDLPSMRTHAAAFLSDIEARPDSPEAGVARRAAGVTCWFAGDYREAQDHLERAFAQFQTGRDDDLAFRFGVDPGAAAMIYLAFVSWPFGEADRAISLIDRMHRRIANFTHVGTLAFAIGYAAFFELMRGDRARAVPDVFELARLARAQELTMFRAFAMFLEGWATAADGAAGGGLEDMRRGTELLREQNVLLFDGLLKIALAEAEARAGDPGRAVSLLDETLATHDRMGYRAFEAELHRARGEILLKRDPPNPAPAEEAFLTAVGVAKRQGTRSFQLRAALSLAKLYLSAARPADAHAVLAPALKGFLPTSEMPEISEAQALLAALDGNSVNVSGGLSAGS